MRKRKLAKGISMLFSGLIALGSILSCYSDDNYVSASATCNLDTGGCKCGGSDVDPRQWNQGAWNNPINAQWAGLPVGGNTVAGIGCYLTSISMEMGLSGDFDGKMCPAAFVNCCNAHGKIGGGGDFCGQSMDFIEGDFANIFLPAGSVTNDIVKEAASEAQKSGLQFGKDSGRMPDGVYGNNKYLMYSLACQLALNGAYIIVDVPGHYMPVVDVIRNESPATGTNKQEYLLVLSDVGGAATNKDRGSTGGKPEEDAYEVMAYCQDDFNYYNNLEDARYKPLLKTYSGSSNLAMYSLDDIRVFVSASKFTPGSANAANGNSASAKRKAAEANYFQLGHFLEEEYFISVDDMLEADLQLPTVQTFYIDGGYERMERLEDWKNTLEYRDMAKQNSVLRIIVMILGILIIVYSLVLFMFYNIDRVNNLFDCEFLGIVTFNRLGVRPDDTPKGVTHGTSNGVSKKLVDMKEMIIICVIGIALGLLIISGRIFLIVANVIKVIREILS